ncbi:MAG: LuxR C-terminal-related transcriptional regulator [Myroides sp.]|jgi:DNA-binding CsgD family transcriptional regulator|uniref:Helix-turn-helix transcriptional regulator n=1 Tax=Myroides marinus TaxID=703342 RepID=A0A163XM57_9FLAO|nr:LuxR C-terminal-related transcriptional regulator [Myroides marinus]MDR0194935.1 LuxR C-terminal-related transcriptional regulator [Myroides sp.]KZE78116.1 helix-turn-helix transcriptional regulator [Myroides marinus]MDM1368110.1 winged helix-turn-helix transcriptional regulator [Myroides marinus]MDM1371305.1 winged helix-turn-helix transcriptional regulator [Myroides marinus]MDM1381207.1 winged helix-turn-helix transcriptional regulator [Myroides marinus]
MIPPPLLNQFPFFETDTPKYIIIGLYYGISFLSIIILLTLYVIFKYKKLGFNLLLQLSIFLNFLVKDIIYFYLPDHHATIGYLVAWNIGTSLVLLILQPYPFLRFKHKQQFYKTGIIVLFALVSIELISSLFIIPKPGSSFIHPITIILTILALYLFFILNHSYSYKNYISFLIICIATSTIILAPSVNDTLYELFIVWPTLRLMGVPILIFSSCITMLEIKKINERNSIYKKYLYQYMYLVKDYHKKLEHERNLNAVRPSIEEDLDISDSKEEPLGVLKEKYSLTERELEVLSLLWEGATNKEIADELFISINTCKYHISKIYVKLNINSRAQIYAFKDKMD